MLDFLSPSLLADVALWNTNGTSVDLLLRQAALSGADRLMADANVSYAVLIDDLQRNIEAENPPAEVIHQLQNRKGTQQRECGLVMAVPMVRLGVEIHTYTQTRRSGVRVRVRVCMFGKRVNVRQTCDG